MTIGRHAEAARAYLSKDKEARREMVLHASCDTGQTFGYMRAITANGWEHMARVRRQSGKTRKDRFKRKSDFYHVLSMQADRIAIAATHGRLP